MTATAKKKVKTNSTPDHVEKFVVDEDTQTVLGGTGVLAGLTNKEIKNVDIRQVKPAPHNPSARMTNKQRLRPLLKSIAAKGLHYPLLVTPRLVVIDGHRRLAVLKQLGATSVPVIVSEDDPDATYGDVNNTQSRMSGNDTLGIWLANPDAVTHGMRTRLETYERKLGRKLMQEIYNAGLSQRTFKTAGQLSNYCDRQDSPDFFRKCVVWMMRYEATGQIDTIIQMKAPAAAIIKAIENMKPVRLRMEVE